MKFKLPKRCPYCAHKVNEEGKCVNPECIAYDSEEEKKERDEE
ncbi:MAG: hypothetical protein ACLVLA_12900 [Acidaminococcus intestini]|jgi:hypothetical protein|nr:hypothetical protein [Acidaminococcus intestini]DAY91310.1 MAG TPA: DNA ligase [Caudoviricetes sp.]